ncbi:MAG: YbfB/YjiJ family MFS transporter, partial [Peptococcaceae bacterium]|nr:YbfB/YjiJ family MFS transporter [Peptococcaceae bacterium]
AIGVLGIVGGILWGVVSDRLGRKQALALVFGLQAVSFFLFAVAGAASTLYISAFLYGLSAFSIPGIVAAACGDYMGPRLAPAALGMVTLFFPWARPPLRPWPASWQTRPTLLARPFCWPLRWPSWAALALSPCARRSKNCNKLVG